MKKYLLIVAVFFGLQTQAQFIANPCDSVDVSFTSSAFSVDLEATIPSSYLATSWNWVSVSNSLNQVDSTQMITLIVSPIIDTTRLSAHLIQNRMIKNE